MTMDEFKTKGGVLSGREERYDEFEGVPKNIGGGTAGGLGHIRDGTHSSHTGSEHHRHGDYDNTPNHHGTTGVGSGTAATGLTGHSTHASRDPSGNTARESTLSNTASGNTGRHVGTDGTIGHSSTTGHHDSANTTHGKPSLMDKLNPKVDANGDGKAGFMK
jgi:hypothetical protein